jgi:hypothetical protein
VGDPLPPAGWYVDPEMLDTQRYWDGRTWTDKRAPLDRSDFGTQGPEVNGDGGRIRFATTWLGLWLLLATVAAVLMHLVDQGDGALGRRLVAHGATTEAVVTGLQPKNHNSVEYTFFVGGRRFYGGGFADGPDGDASHHSVGGPIQIVYDTTDPSVSCACDPVGLARSDSWPSSLGLAAFITSIPPPLITIQIERRRRSRRAPTPRQRTSGPPL